MNRQLIILLGAALCTVSIHAIAYNAADSFSHTLNPNGVWTYGWDDGSFHLFTRQTEIAPNAFFWQGGNGPLGEPTAGANEGDSPYIIHGSTVYLPGELGLHPGSSGQRAVLRWTAPNAGFFQIDATFKGGDPLTTTDVQIRTGANLMLSGIINGNVTPLSYSGLFFASPNQIVDFSVGFGQNHTFWYDTTLAAVTISDFILPGTPPPGPGPDPSPSPVPETGSTLLLFSAAFLAVSGTRMIRGS